MEWITERGDNAPGSPVLSGPLYEWPFVYSESLRRLRSASMGTRKRPEGTVPWIPGFRYSALLPALSLNLLVRDTSRAADFYRDVMNGEVHYLDIDFAAVRAGTVEIMLHADHTHDTHPWFADLATGQTRGLGSQFRLLGVLDPDEVAKRAKDHGAVIIEEPANKGHGWREVLVRDPDGYEWAIGVLVPPAKGPFGPQPAPQT